MRPSKQTRSNNRPFQAGDGASRAVLDPAKASHGQAAASRRHFPRCTSTGIARASSSAARDRRVQPQVLGTKGPWGRLPIADGRRQWPIKSVEAAVSPLRRERLLGTKWEYARAQAGLDNLAPITPFPRDALSMCRPPSARLIGQFLYPSAARSAMCRRRLQRHRALQSVPSRIRRATRNRFSLANQPRYFVRTADKQQCIIPTWVA